MIKDIKEFVIHEIVKKSIEKSRKLANNLGVLLNGENAHVGIVSLVICLSEVIPQQDLISVDSAFELLKSLLEDTKNQQNGTVEINNE